MSALYIETSALMAMILNEPHGAAALDQIERSTRLVASRLVRLEAERALHRLTIDRPGDRSIADMRRELVRFWPNVDFLEISEDICDRAGRIAPTARLRSLDAIHLASYCRVRELEPKLELLSFDRRILDAMAMI